MKNNHLYKIIFILACSACAVILPPACSNKSVSTVNYSLPSEDYQPRLKASDPSTWKAVENLLVVPEKGIELADNSLFKLALERNAHYLLNSFSVNHMLVPFRLRAGEQNPPDDHPQVDFWDKDLRGSNAGRFMMGAGNTLRWIENDTLRNRLNELVDGIEACSEPDGYILAYPHIIDSLRSEEPNYARAWFTHGLIDAAIAGNPKAYKLLRGHADWFNSWNELHPKLLHWHNNSHQGHIASTRTYLSPIGKPEDLQIAEKYYICDWWIDGLTARNDSAVWQYPLQNPHSYLITSFEAYLDHYIATGDKTYLNAALGAWDLIHDNWEHVGGSMAICEAQWFEENGKRVLKHFDKKHENCHPPHSYRLGADGHTGETCGSVFWIKFNQRLHRLFPDNERYVAEIEKSIYNVILACQNEKGGIRYHATMQGGKEQPGSGSNTCCEGQGTRALGSLPEYIYSIAKDGLYVNLYEPSTISWKHNGQDVALKQETKFPYDTNVTLTVATSSPQKMNLHIRVPSWATSTMDITVNGEKVASGKPGSYQKIAREWNNGDKIDFTLPAGLKYTQYEGTDPAPANFKRFAVEYGPVLLAAINKEKDINIIDQERIIPDPSRPLYFNVENNSSFYYMPYWLLSKEAFTVFTPLSKNIEKFDLNAHISSPGFTVEFFPNEKWEGKPVYKGTTSAINYPDENKQPIAKGVPVEHFSSRFTGEFVSPRTGTILFIISSDDGYRFSVNDKEMAQSIHHTNHSPVLCEMAVTAGEKYDICFEHAQGKGEYRIILEAVFINSSEK